MPAIKYTGTQQRWPELAVTGRQSVWSPGQMEDRTAAEAASLIAAGNFELVGGDLVMLPITTAELASPSEATLRNVNAVFRTSSGALYQSNGSTLQPFSGASLSGAAEDLTISAGSFTFTGPAGRFVLNHQAVHFPLLANMPGFGGARPVVNFFLNSSTPAAPTAWDTMTDGVATFAATTDTLNGATIGALTITNSASAGGPYERAYFGNWYGAGNGPAPYNPGQWSASNAWPPGQIMVMRAQARTVTAPTGWNIYQRHRDDSAAPTESLGGNVTLTTGFQAITAAMESNAAYGALGTRITLAASGTGDGRVAQIQLEDLTGDKGPYVPGEYVPAGAAPGWRWFNTAKANTRTKSGFTTDYAALVPLKNPTNSASVSGILTEGVGATLTGLLGLLMEPQASNLCGGWNTLANIGHAKASGAIIGMGSRPPFLSGSTTAYIEAPSGQMVGNYNGTAPTDITLTLNGVSAGNDSIDSSSTNFITAGFFVGMNIWVWRADTLTFGPMPVASVTANKIGLTGTFFGSTRASGTATRIMRCPGNGDNIMLLLNDGSAHYTTVSGTPTLPAAGAWQTKAGITLTLAAAPPSDGGWVTTDNGTKCYYWKDHTDFGITISDTSNGRYARPVLDRTNLIAAGLGYLCPSGLALEIYGGTSGSATVTLGATGSLGAASRDTQISAWAYRSSGSGSMVLKLESHANTVAVTDAAYTRKSVQQTSAGAQSRPAVVTATNTTIRLIGWSVEQAGAAAAVATISSPIPTFGDTAAKSRTATRCTRPWGGTAKNNIARSMTWTPTQGSLTGSSQKQTLWSLYVDASNYLELSITGATLTWRKRRGGTNYDITASHTPVAGTPVTLAFACRDTTGLTLSVNGVAATPSTADLFDITALTPAAVEDIGSLNGGSVAFGYFRGLGVT